MNILYFGFINPQLNDKKENDSTSGLESFIVKMLNSIIPVGNPDYNEQIGEVYKWLVEYSKEGDKVCREIGLNDKGEVILILPQANNLGYWTNSNLNLDSYKAYNFTEISKENFEEKWNSVSD